MKSLRLVSPQGKKLSFSLCLGLRLASFSRDGYIDTFLLNAAVERLAKSE